MCSQIFVEGRRIRTLVADLRDMLSGDLEAPPREAVNEYMEALQRAVALGDIAADTLVAQHAAPHP